MRLLAFVMLLSPAPDAAAAPVPPAPVLPAGARIGYVVTDETGAVLAEQAADQRMVPASTTKLFTTAAALALLGDVTRPDDAAGATVAFEGADVVLAGHGDARLSSAPDCVTDCLATLADAVAAALPNRTVGAVIGDDSAMADERWPSGMSWDNMATISGTAVSALTLDDNLASAPGLRPQAVHDPALRAAIVLRAMLEARGVRVTGAASVRHRMSAGAPSAASEILARTIPAPLADDIALTLRQSQNLHAELLLRRLSPAGTVAAGRAARDAALAPAALPPGSVSLYDGSGMSSYDRVTPRALVTLLRWGNAQPWSALWRAGLPVAGQSGTLKNRLRGTPLEGKLAAKTGTLMGTQTLAGFLATAHGRTLTFAVLVNDLPEGASASRFVDALVLDWAARY
ncbi:D-alanyl-D-alanine carboxypeptidase/D-alanyl-D-alanine endopeptidase [Novosphingobium sp.]|uniref:D-alanyl-D-alanine carboxypeptidase/D-alanyl-D-alanine endopeptidase n=1 Tax=Novosphingobium sp. TaxID=1874826 RepID=UPI002FDE004C